MNIRKRIEIKRFLNKHPLLNYSLFPIILIRRIWLKIKSNLYDSVIKTVDKGNIVISLPEFLGSFEFDFRSDILKNILIFKGYEPDLVEIIKTYIDSRKDVLDIGANVGLYTVLFSKSISKKNKVLAVEPTPSALRYLHRNIENNDCSDSVKIVEGIVTNHKGIYKINFIEGKEEYSSLGHLSHPSILQNQFKQLDVEGDTIDNLVDLFKLEPGLIKIDTEGAEYLVLQGAIKTIQKYKPIILFELSDLLLKNFNATSKMVTKFLKNNNYKLIDVEFPDTSIHYPFNGNLFAYPILADQKNVKYNT